MTELAEAFRGLSDIDQTPPLDASDLACLTAVRQVLRDYGKLDRLGVTLLHTHFPVHEGEVLVESCDPINRRLTITVVPEVDVDPLTLTETAWRLTEGTAMLKCVNGCVVKDGKHRPKHVTVGG